MDITTSDPRIEASAKYIRMSPHKARRVVDQIRGRAYEQALMILEFMPYRVCDSISQLISSAAANANHNFGLSKTDLFIDAVQVDGGSFLKRIRSGARGRTYPIHKPTCHITVVMRIDSGWRNKISLRKFGK
uniref:Large ribosomal subunit protein uL22c n=1 Tax=Aneura pinguis TaxID=39026 RepID=A0A1Z1G5G9_ANEPI|nr:ribosomal protein L22 [Aneura pinguis]WGO58450.1 ribosomal protein L22 [Aneura pinguis]WGO58536.1 ribosomal protein L22 [Aneura pinguis]WGO58622.1 ribosomal protein L22 [Aneura pinguis]WGO58708.1 ribosomal protein L22 [Aneura pinguis]